MAPVFQCVADVLGGLTEAAKRWADVANDLRAPVNLAGDDFAGLNLVGIDLSTSIRWVAPHLITGLGLWRQQEEAMRPDHGVWMFGVNALTFPLTHQPVRPGQLPRLGADHFQLRGFGAGLIQSGSAFYDYLMNALGYARQFGAFDPHPPLPVTISLLCDGAPNGGGYGPADVRPLMDEARVRGVMFRVVGFVLYKYREWMDRFVNSLGLGPNDMQITYCETVPDREVVLGTCCGLSY
jgi:hypothetical protein